MLNCHYGQIFFSINGETVDYDHDVIVVDDDDDNNDDDVDGDARMERKKKF